MESIILFLIPALGILGLVVMAVNSAWVSKQATGDENMVELSNYIAEGAMAFLKAEWKVLTYFAIIAAIVLAFSGMIGRNFFADYRGFVYSRRNPERDSGLYRNEHRN